MSCQVGIVRFLGTNCDRDIWQAVEAAGHNPKWLWFQDRFEENEVDAVVIPGGFSYGDTLRAGVLAARSVVMDSVRAIAAKGKPVLGICNGFQVLCESGLLPGALLRNESLRFIDEWAELELVESNPHWASKFSQGQRVRLPIAHGEGRYYLDAEELNKLEGEGGVWWRYSSNPNGSLNDIAGVTNKARNVTGLMPHPERALFQWMQGEDGLPFFTSLG